MTTVTHHVPLESLVAYASGAATAGEDLLVACHLALCPRCRAVVDEAEQVGGALALQESADLPSGALDALMARLDGPLPEAPAPPPPCRWFPAPLRRAIGPLERVPWRNLGLGMRVAPVQLDDHQRTFLLDFPPGFRIPAHDHVGAERGLVLRGGFTADGEAFARGDVSWCEQPHHDVRVDDDGERCTTLFVNDGRLEVGPDWVNRLVDWWIVGR